MTLVPQEIHFVKKCLQNPWSQGTLWQKWAGAMSHLPPNHQQMVRCMTGTGTVLIQGTCLQISRFESGSTVKAPAQQACGMKFKFQYQGKRRENKTNQNFFLFGFLRQGSAMQPRLALNLWSFCFSLSQNFLFLFFINSQETSSLKEIELQVEVEFRGLEPQPLCFPIQS